MCVFVLSSPHIVKVGILGVNVAQFSQAEGKVKLRIHRFTRKRTHTHTRFSPETFCPFNNCLSRSLVHFVFVKTQHRELNCSGRALGYFTLHVLKIDVDILTPETAGSFGV